MPPLSRRVLLLVVVLAPSLALAQVREPNGVNAPVITTATGETTLQAYFDAQTENINAVTAAAAEPGVFLPLCDFQATLVLSQSQALAGIAWYNVPADPNQAPAAIYEIVPPGTPVGQIVTSADVRTNPNYALGLIGFVLTKQGQRVYYSEYRRNVLCSQCATPDYWKMSLAYRSNRFPNTYYLAFEDWEGANNMTWFGNDGDFNDKVFRISGVTCEGGGASCDTTRPGVCSNGVTECQPGGTIMCKQQIQPSAEKCDNLDNDCNGMVDDGNGLCPGNQVCDHGNCIAPCGVAEFDCIPPLVCNDGLCVDPGCIGMTCETGKVCRGGNCIGGCEGVRCPADQECQPQLGLCIDPCEGVSCPGAVCDRGACVMHCSCRFCDTGKVCAASGACVDSGCESMTCPTGQVCRGGACMDGCTDAVCPGGAACHDGVCDPPMIVAPSGSAGSGGGNPTTGAGGAGGAGSGGGGRGGSAGPDGGGALPDGGALDGRRVPITPTCGCDAADTHARSGTLLALLIALGVAAARRRRAPARQRARRR